MIIGLTGSYCSGKDTIADFLVSKYGFKHFSLSDIIRGEMSLHNIEPTRENLITFGANLRSNNGNSVLAEKVLAKISDGNFCITSIRHPDEVEFLRKRKDFVLVNVDADKNLRFARMQTRNRAGDPKTIEKFIELEKRESQSEGSGQQLTKTAAAADITFLNNSTDKEILNSEIAHLLEQIKISQRH
ncbi:MAG: AAA family ATPase [Elusimicrobiota bacterium]|jgi:dCMP deaminase|nr:AAA family ATPase [Elusimicrobiota bacterium]